MGRLRSFLSPLQFEVVLGSLLGDARLECRSGKRGEKTARLRIHHSEKQKDYVLWKYEILKDFVSKGPRRIMVWHDLKRDHTHYSWYFHTTSFREFGMLHGEFYQGDIKILPEDIFRVMTPRMLAVWFMDDGSNTQESFTFSTHCFSVEDQRKIVAFFHQNYGVDAKIVKDRTKHKLAIGRFEYKRFKQIVEPYIIPSMIYKIDNPRNDFISSEMRYVARAIYKTSVFNQDGD